MEKIEKILLLYQVYKNEASLIAKKDNKILSEKQKHEYAFNKLKPILKLP